MKPIKIRQKILNFMVMGLVSGLSLSLSVQSQANELDFSLGDDALRVQYHAGIKGNDLNWNLDFLNNEDDGRLLGLGAYVSGRSNASTGRQTAGVGGRVIYIDWDGPNGSALAFGGFIRHTLSQANLLSVRGELFYAPGVTSFDAAEDFLEFSFRMEYQLLDAAEIYLGYRNIEVDAGPLDVELDESLILGLIMKF